MKVAYLIDKESLGGGCEYIAHKSAVRQACGDETRVFYSNRGECTVAKIDAWSADEIVVNHLREGDSWAERYLKCAPVVVSPSRWEGMPYLLMKARALACRILATDCPGNRDVLKGYEKWEVLDL